MRVAAGQDQSGCLAFLRTDGTEDVGGRGTQVLRRRGTAAEPGPAARDFVLLADAGFVGEPDLYGAAVDALGLRDLVQARGEVFLKASMAPSACA